MSKYMHAANILIISNHVKIKNLSRKDKKLNDHTMKTYVNMLRDCFYCLNECDYEIFFSKLVRNYIDYDFFCSHSFLLFKTYTETIKYCHDTNEEDDTNNLSIYCCFDVCSFSANNKVKAITI